MASAGAIYIPCLVMVLSEIQLKFVLLVKIQEL
jgi:hypothetical protein